MHYKIRHLPGGAVTGQLVIVNHGGARVTGWQLRVVLPGDDHYQVGHAASTSAGDSLVVTALPGTPALGAGRSARVTFTAEGSTAVPASITFRDAAASQPAQAGSPAGPAQERLAERVRLAGQLVARPAAARVRWLARPPGRLARRRAGRLAWRALTMRRGVRFLP